MNKCIEREDVDRVCDADVLHEVLWVLPAQRLPQLLWMPYLISSRIFFRLLHFSYSFSFLALFKLDHLECWIDEGTPLNFTSHCIALHHITSLHFLFDITPRQIISRPTKSHHITLHHITFHLIEYLHNVLLFAHMCLLCMIYFVYYIFYVLHIVCVIWCWRC